MDTFDQVPFSDIEFADNPQPRCPCVLVLDTSGSMGGAPIAELNRGLDTLRASLELNSAPPDKRRWAKPSRKPSPS